MLTAEGLLMLLVWWVARVVVRRRHRREVRRTCVGLTREGHTYLGGTPDRYIDGASAIYDVKLTQARTRGGVR